MTASARKAATLDSRIAGLPWAAIAADLDAHGHATTGPLLTPAECRGLVSLYDRDKPFRRRIVMQQHGYGQGEYRYFAYPLPDLVATLRAALYLRLAETANRWRTMLGDEGRFPSTLEAFLADCHAAGQIRPTPLLLRYGPGDFNCLHQDLYGERVFPLQLTILLNDPEADFTGGEFLVVEQRPRRQSIAEVVPLRQGEAVIFAVRERPVVGSRGAYRAMLRHGVSRLRSGHRMTLGIIFNDAA